MSFPQAALLRHVAEVFYFREVHMKKVLTVLGVLVVVLGQFFDGAPEWAEAGGELPPCQDINDDGSSDVSDAIFFLQWQFLGGPEPSCPTSNGLPAGLPDTGQTMCSTAAGEQGCGQFFPATCPPVVQDGFLQTGCPNDANRFTDNADDTVSDNCTGLQWQRTPPDSDGNGVSDILTWCAALAYCENLSLAGHDDWRLPNVREVQSIVDYGRPPDDPIDPVFGGSRDNYWSSTSSAAFPSLAWSVGPRGGVEGGSVGAGQKSNLRHVRAVRGAERVGGGGRESAPTLPGHQRRRRD
jgi:hypothetical protein